MASSLPSGATPQFGTAEYKSTPGLDRCQSCNTTLTSRYYRVNGARACENCANRLKLQLPKDTHQVYARGLLFGLGGAIVGLVLYAAFGIITGLMVGYVSLAVGYIVGKAIKVGSRGMGGRRYQIAAVLLTYSAVSIAAVPIYLSAVVKAKKATKQTEIRHVLQQPNPGEQAPAAGNTVPPLAEKEIPSKKAPLGLGAALGLMVFLGLASPFLELQDPLHGIIGLVILFVGIRIAWQLTAGAKLEILGPYDKNAPAPPPPPIAP